MTHTQAVMGDAVAPDGTPFRRVRMDNDLWARLDEAVKRADPDSNRSALLRKFARWYVGDIDEMPQRPQSSAIAEAKARDNTSGGNRSQIRRRRQDPPSA